MTIETAVKHGVRLSSVLLLGTVLGGTPALAQRPARPAPAASAATLLNPAPPAPAPQTDGGTIRTIAVEGSQRIEPDTVRSYVKLRAGEAYTRESLDEALRDLFATELFSDVQIRDDNGALTIIIKENPIINRVVFEGNKRIKEDKLNKELKLAPRQIFTRSKVRAEIARIIELYRRQGRFAASVQPKIVNLDQNRVDLVYEISEGPKSKVRQINIIGNKVFKDGELRGEMATKRASFYRFFASNDTYDPDRLAYDQSKLRQFYLTKGYADFRVVSAVAELTPDRRDFIITYVVEEGDRYKFGDVAVESDLRDLKPDTVKAILPMKKGDWYNAKQVEDTVDAIGETAGLLGYAFTQVDPAFQRDKEAKEMAITFRIADAPRVYVESVAINGNTVTQDKVVRREMRLAEGDAFNSIAIKRSQDRIQSLGFFQEKLEIKQKQGSAPDRVVLEANVEEKSTGELQLSAGYSSLERFIVSASIRQRNFRGKGQELRTSVDYSTYSKSINLGFTEPYLFDKNIAVGFDIFRRDLNSFNFTQNGDRNTTYSQLTTGFQVRFGVPLTEYLSVAGRYGLSQDKITLDRNTYFFDPDGDGINDQCDPLIAGRYLCDAIGSRTTSSVGYSLVWDDLNNRIRPSRGQRTVFSQDFAGLGGSVRYLRTTGETAKYWDLGGRWIFSVRAEGGGIVPFGKSRGPFNDRIRLNDRFFLGEPQLRGFDIRGVGPRVQRTPYVPVTDANGVVTDYKLSTDRSTITDDALGGRAYYVGHLELEIPLGSGVRELGIRPSIFLDAGSVFGLTRPDTQDLRVDKEPGKTLLTRPVLNSDGLRQCTDGAATPTLTPLQPGQSCAAPLTLYTTQFNGFSEIYYPGSAKPRVSIGIGFNWNSPFGPLRLDIAKALLKQRGDDTKLFTFNVGTQF